jgi:hypothetical protein
MNIVKRCSECTRCFCFCRLVTLSETDRALAPSGSEVIQPAAPSRVVCVSSVVELWSRARCAICQSYRSDRVTLVSLLQQQSVQSELYDQ